MKVMTILGTRPEIIRLSAVIARLDTAPTIDHVLVHTGQNWDPELSEIFFTDLGLRNPDHFLNASRKSLAHTYGDIMVRTEAVLLDELPDAVLILGDTNSAIAAVIARRMKVPVFHMEAGNRSFDANVPEEVNRRIVDHTADFNLVYTEHARRNLLAEGLEPRRIHLTGSPMREVLDRQRTKIEASTVTADMDLEPGEFFLVSAHREENVDHPGRLAKLIDAVTAVGERWNKPVLVSLHPRTRNRLGETAEAIERESRIVFHPPFGFNDYNRLQLDAACVLSDSGTITEEASILEFSAVTIRDSMERPEGLDAGAIIMCGLETDEVVAAVETCMAVPAEGVSSLPDGYEISDTSHRVLRLILSLTGRSTFWSGLH